MKTVRHSLCSCFLLLALGLPAHAAENGAQNSPSSTVSSEAVGMVKTSRGTAMIERGTEKLPATVGAQLFEKDRLRTGADGALGVTLRDNTLLSAGPNSLVALEKFSFDDTTHDGKMSVGVRKGTLSVATGKIAKRAPESVDFRTPTAVLGVRGTEFVVEVIGGRDE
ncbi:FecR domain-containing protein [Azonexus sp.]|uniref:FecR family protein n=1 Tax=Azonexus sp. TaxID=1872668 RepID=UPI0039E3C23C